MSQLDDNPKPVCSHCGAAVAVGANRCWRCHELLPATESPVDTVSPTPRRPKEEFPLSAYLWGVGLTVVVTWLGLVSINPSFIGWFTNEVIFLLSLPFGFVLTALLAVHRQKMLCPMSSLTLMTAFVVSTFIIMPIVYWAVLIGIVMSCSFR